MGDVVVYLQFNSGSVLRGMSDGWVMWLSIYNSIQFGLPLVGSRTDFSRYPSLRGVSGGSVMWLSNYISIQFKGHTFHDASRHSSQRRSTRPHQRADGRPVDDLPALPAPLQGVPTVGHRTPVLATARWPARPTHTPCRATPNATRNWRISQRRPKAPPPGTTKVEEPAVDDDLRKILL